MKLSSIIALAAVASTSAYAPPADRRAFIAKAASTATAFTAATVASSPAFAKDQYALDTGDVVVPEKKVEKKGDGGGLVAVALGGSVVLSLPFFLPNLLRLAGVKNAKNPDQK